MLSNKKSLLRKPGIELAVFVEFDVFVISQIHFESVKKITEKIKTGFLSLNFFGRINLEIKFRISGANVNNKTKARTNQA